MTVGKVSLVSLKETDREQFILDNQWAFKYGAMLEFGMRDDHIDEHGEIISRTTIEQSIDAPDNETYRIVVNDENMGGVILKINPETMHNHLEILFISPKAHSLGIGFDAWKAVEALHPETKIWETFTPYFEKRNIHFYVNKCGFRIVNFYTEHNPLPLSSTDGHDGEGPEEMFRFIKVMDTDLTDRESTQKR